MCVFDAASSYSSFSVSLSVSLSPLSYAHEQDPVASDGPHGVFRNFNHDVATSKQVVESTTCDDCLFMCCPFTSVTTKVVTTQHCAAKSRGCSRSGSTLLGNLVSLFVPYAECAYYFVTYHGDGGYGDL